MSLLAGLEYGEQLEPGLRSELEQVLATVQAAFGRRETEGATNVLLGLEYENQYDPIVHAELEQLCAAIQTAFNTQASRIVSQQTGTITLGVGVASQTATLTTPVMTDYAVCRLTGQRTSEVGTDAEFSTARVRLTNATTVTASRLTGGPATVVVAYEVTEYVPAVLAQPVLPTTITLASPATSGSATLGRALGNTAKVELHPAGIEMTASSGGAEDLPDVTATVALSGNQTVTATRPGSNGNMAVQVTVVEFN